MTAVKEIVAVPLTPVPDTPVGAAGATGLIVKDCITGAAAAYGVPMFVPPACVAVIVHMPAVTKLIVKPVVVQTAIVPEFNVTARPDEAVAPEATEPALNGCAPGLLKVIVCGAPFTTMDCAKVVGEPTPLAAWTVKLKVPVAVGVPESTPPVLRVNPVGKAPAEMVKVGAGDPVAV